MTLSISFYDGVKYHGSDFNNRDKDILGNGVLYPATSQFPLTYPTTPNMTFNVGAGVAWVDGYRIANDSNVVTLTVSAADATNPRIDIVQLGHDDINSTYSLVVKQGVAQASPIEPGADAGYIKLYAINVAANATSITSANVTDRRTVLPLNVNGSQIQTGGNVANTDPAYTAVKNGTYVQAGAGIATTSGTNQQTVAVAPATSSALGGVKVGSGVTVQPDGTISVTPYTLPSDVAKTDANNNWTAIQTFPGWQSKSNGYFQPQGVATSATNYASYALEFQRSYWSNGAATTGTSYWVVDQSGNLLWKSESGAVLLQITQSGATIFNNTVTTTASGASVQQWLGRTGTSAGTVGIGGDANGFGVWDSTGANKAFTVNPTTFAVNSKNNTQDDGATGASTWKGNMTLVKDAARFYFNRASGGTNRYGGFVVQDNGVGSGLNQLLYDYTNTCWVIADSTGTNFYNVYHAGNLGTKGAANGVASLDGTGNVPASQLANASSVKARASDTQLTTTTATAVASYTPSAQGNFSAKVYVRVATAATNVTITVTYTSGSGAQMYTMQTGSLAVGDHSFPAYFFNATAAAINVNVTAGTANQVYASASIVGE